MGVLCENELSVGNIVMSTKGHDKGRLYAVVAVVSENFVLLADGVLRKVDNPKLKRIKHIKLLRCAKFDCNNDEIAIQIKLTEERNA